MCASTRQSLLIVWPIRHAPRFVATACMEVELADKLLIAVLTASIAGSAWLTWRNNAKHLAATTTPPAPPPKPPCPPGFLPVLSAEALLHEIAAEPLLFRIRQALGFAPENYALDVQPLIDTVAEFVQLLPASESHHHANPGGLLTHVLEVAAVALLRSEEAKLPVGRPTEEQLKFAARWHYGILVAALLHDIGKPIADVAVTVRTPSGDIKPWNGLGGRLADVGDCYRVQFPLRHDYQAHQRLPVMLLKAMVPASTMRWLAEDAELMDTLIAFFSGESDGGALGKLVKAADGKSVADNLLQGDRTRFATARQVPLIERLMAALRRMLSEGDLSLNREGAAGFCDGTDAWFVAGTLADKVRAYLDKHEIRETGASDLPTDNSRLFDTWYDYAAIRPNAGAAIWKAQVSLDKGDGHTWSQTFTMLRFPLDKLYPSPEAYPQALAGHIDLASVSTVDASAVNARINVEAIAMLAPEQPTDIPAPAATPEFELTPVSLDDLTPLLPQAESVAVDTDTGEFLDQSDCAFETMLPQSSPAPSTASMAPTAPVSPAQPRLPKNSVTHDMPTPDEDSERLMAWIQRSVADGNLVFNRATAAVHFVKEGMLLISPKIFREFLQASGVATTEGDATPVKRLQKLLQKSGYVSKNKPNSYLHHYRILNAKNPERSLVTGYLVPNPQDFFNPVPEPNAHLESSSGNRVAEENP